MQLNRIEVDINSQPFLMPNDEERGFTILLGSISDLSKQSIVSTCIGDFAVLISKQLFAIFVSVNT